jgi:predicted nucleotidyltransferase
MGATSLYIFGSTARDEANKDSDVNLFIDYDRNSKHTVTFAGGADLPVYLRVTQSDGHQAWSSPIYLIA